MHHALSRRNEVKHKTAVALVLSFAALPFFFVQEGQAGLWAGDGKTAITTDSSKWRSPRFRNLDANKNDEITKEEFLKDQLDDFTRRDEDKDGALSPDEIDFPPGTPPEMRDMMRKQMQEDEEKRKAEDTKRQAEEAKKAAASAKEEPKEQPKEAPAEKTKAEKPKAEATKPAENKPVEAKPAEGAAATETAPVEAVPETTGTTTSQPTTIKKSY